MFARGLVSGIFQRKSQKSAAYANVDVEPDKTISCLCSTIPKKRILSDSMLYPVLRRKNEGVACGGHALGFRV